MKIKIILLLMLILNLVQAQTVPAPKQPEEPRQNFNLSIEALYQGKPATGLTLQLNPGPRNPNKLQRLRLGLDATGKANWSVASGDWVLNVRNEKTLFSLVVPISPEYLNQIIKIGPYQISITQ